MTKKLLKIRPFNSLKNNNVFNFLAKQIYEEKSTNAIFKESYFKKNDGHNEINIYSIIC